MIDVLCVVSSSEVENVGRPMHVPDFARTDIPRGTGILNVSRLVVILSGTEWSRRICLIGTHNIFPGGPDNGSRFFLKRFRVGARDDGHNK
ncbi:MAG: hypothetical protein JWO44_899 [Bacteroidetes bacterium]|nr:hypothetical protein [Bacteroidota bacterium]